MNLSIVGIIVILAVAVLFSTNRKAINPRVVLTAFALQAFIAFFALVLPTGRSVLAGVSGGVQTVIDYANVGVTFLFGDLASDKLGFILAVRVLPVLIFISSLTAVLYHLGIMQFFVRTIGTAIRWVTGAERTESLVAAGNIFVGPIESPLFVRPYLAGLTRAQLFTVAAVGLSSVSGAILISYAGLGISLDYLVPAAFMAAPGGLLMAKIMLPDEPGELGKSPPMAEGAEGLKKATNVIEAATDGAIDGVKLAALIGGVLLAFVALIAMVNGILAGLTSLVGLPPITMEQILGYVFMPIVYLLGIPGEDVIIAGNLLGQKLILNEFIAFVQLIQVQDQLTPYTQAVITFAICGFANLNALGILMGGLGGLLPQRKAEIAQLGMRAVLAATLSNLMSAALAGFMLGFG